MAAGLTLKKSSGGQITLVPEDGTTSETIIIPRKGIGTGKVAHKIEQTSRTFGLTDDTAVAVPSFSVTMTSTNSSNKHLVHVRIFGEYGTNDHDLLGGIYVNGVDYNSNQDAVNQRVKGLTISQGLLQSNNDSSPTVVEFTTLISTSTAGTLVFQPWLKAVSGTTTFYMNRSLNAADGGAYERGSSEIIVQEIFV